MVQTQFTVTTHGQEKIKRKTIIRSNQESEELMASIDEIISLTESHVDKLKKNDHQ